MEGRGRRREINLYCIESSIFAAYPIVLVVGDHDEEIAVEALGQTLGDQHVVGPATAAEVELELIRGTSSWAIGIQIAEGALERNSHTGLCGTTTNGVGSWVQGDNELVQLNHHQTLFAHQEGLTTLVILGGNEDAHVAEALCTSIVVHTNCIREGHVGKMSEASEDIATWCEVEAT